MKIRIKSNMVRFRLTRSEVETFGRSGLISEHTPFGPLPEQIFSYALVCKEGIDGLQASFDGRNIQLFMSPAERDEWVKTQRVGFQNIVDLGNGKNLHLLIEKDFKCLDETTEDQSDNYPNPLAQKSS